MFVVFAHYRYLMMNAGSPRLLVIPNADLQTESQDHGSYLDQLLTFKRKRSLAEKAKSVFFKTGRILMQVRECYSFVFFVFNVKVVFFS